MSGSLEQRLRRLEDLEEIQRLFMDYRRHLDARDLHAYSLLFARDGEWIGATGYARTPAGIQAMLEERLRPNPPAPGATHYHLVANPIVELDGDRASAQTTWMLVTRGEGDAPELTLFGHYRDQLIREDGRWRFLRREAHVEIPTREIASPP